MVRQANFPHEAIAAIDEVLQIGAKKHPPGDWRNESCEHHAAKALGHLKDFVYGVHTNQDGEDTLKHALCRLAMAVCIRDKGNLPRHLQTRLQDYENIFMGDKSKRGDIWLKYDISQLLYDLLEMKKIVEETCTK